MILKVELLKSPIWNKNYLQVDSADFIRKNDNFEIANSYFLLLPLVRDAKKTFS